MTLYKTGDVVLIPFPFTDFSTFKQRPAVIISSDKFNRIHGDVIIAAITSHISHRQASDEYLMEKTDQQTAGLPKPSIVKLGKIATIDQRLIRKCLGRLPNKTIVSILTKVRVIFTPA